MTIFAFPATFAVLLLIGVAVSVIPAWTIAVYAVMSVFAFVAYGADKAASHKGRRRTSEATLHLMSLLGGWPGAWIAQGMFRHKTRKQPFRTVFWVTVAANAALLAVIVYEAPRLLG